MRYSTDVIFYLDNPVWKNCNTILRGYNFFLIALLVQNKAPKMINTVIEASVWACSTAQNCSRFSGLKKLFKGIFLVAFNFLASTSKRSFLTGF